MLIEYRFCYIKAVKYMQIMLYENERLFEKILGGKNNEKNK